ncbi:MAG TPA: tetratricopeptide repeat protein [Dongiaceae bacterium]|nr:tetratricopeptide repeat protein [Dongiaceae bacterium]
MRRRAAVGALAVAAILGGVAAPDGGARAADRRNPAPPAPAAAPSRPAPERSTRELLQAGGLAIEEGNFAAARDRFREAADIDPRLTQAHFGMALAALGLRDRRAADKSLHTAIELAPTSAEVRYALGVTEFAFGDPRAAEPDLRAAADADKRFLEARYAVGLAAANRSDFAASETAFREALKLEGLDPASHFMLGVVLARAGLLDDAMGELARAVDRAPSIQEARPDDALRFAARAVPPATASATLGLPMPLIRPAISWAAKAGGAARGGAAARGAAATPARPEIPDWFLYYHMGLQLEDAGQWGPSVDMMQKALALKDRSEGLAVVADRLVDYSPHWHLASADHHLGRYRDAFLHLGIARNEGNASADALAALEVLIQKDRLRPRILLDALPDRTTDESVTVRGVVLADEAVNRVEISGREALLRPAGAMEVADRLPDAEKGTARDAGQAILFELANQRLVEGSNLIEVRPYFRNPARNGDLLEARVVRLPPPPPKPEPPPAPAKPATPPKGGTKKPAPKPPLKPPAGGSGAP